jgi:hypothetical protein
MKTKSPGKRNHRKGHCHTPTVKRWAKRKREEALERLEDRIQVNQEFKGRTGAAIAYQRMKEIQAIKKKQEREMLATTSLKDIIK